MDKHIGPGIVADEPVTLGVIEPFHFSGHRMSPDSPGDLSWDQGRPGANLTDQEPQSARSVFMARVGVKSGETYKLYGSEGQGTGLTNVQQIASRRGWRQWIWRRACGPCGSFSRVRGGGICGLRYFRRLRGARFRR